MDLNDDRYDRNSRLESFLLRKMTSSGFESVRYYEPCIVRRGNTVQYQTAVVTEAGLFSVEEPPKHLQQLVRLLDIVSIERVHDIVEFLREPLRDKVQHVRVEYRPRQLVTPTSGRADASDGDGDAGSAATTASSGNGLLTVPTRRTLRRSSDCATERRRTLSRLEEEVEEFSGRLRIDGHPPDRQTARPSLDLSPRLLVDGWPVSPASPDGHPLAADGDQVTLSLLLKRRHAAGSPQPRPTVAGRGPSPGPARHGGEFETGRGMTRSQSALPAYHRSTSARDDLPERSRSVLDAPHVLSRPVKKRSTSLDDVRGASSPPAVQVCHVYLLQEDSPFQRHLSSAWLTRLISGTLAIEQAPVEPVGGAGRVHRQQLDQLLEDLRADLLNCADFEQKCSLVAELKTGATQYRRVRYLFWKDSRLLDLLTGELAACLLSTSSFDSTDDDEEQMLRDREEELDLVVLLMDTLGAVLRDADTIPQAVKMLQHEKGAPLTRLVRALMTQPWVPGCCVSTARHMLADFREFVTAGWDNLPEAELIKLLAEVTNTCSGTLYELLQVLQHMDPSGTALRQGLYKVNLERHLTVAVTQLLAFLYPARATTWSPSEAVLVYQHLKVLDTLIRQLPGTLLFIQRNFTEEFRYYVNTVVVGHKLPEQYPIRHQLLLIMESLAKQIRQPQTSTFSRQPDPISHGRILA